MELAMKRTYVYYLLDLPFSLQIICSSDVDVMIIMQPAEVHLLNVFGVESGKAVDDDWLKDTYLPSQSAFWG